jgi:putative PIN family toxin of toxin-antitoxin system
MNLRAVYDTNVIVSGTLVPGSIPASLLSLAMQGTVQLYLSPAILDEYHAVLLRPKFGFQQNIVKTFLNDLQKTAVMVHPIERITLSPDEPDNRFLECAMAAAAGFLVTGNTKHFPALEYQGTKIVTPAEFAALLIQ